MTILTFFTKILSRSAQWRSCFAFTFPCEREAGLNINKVCDFVMNEKYTIFISCVFNGFKYICNISPFIKSIVIARGLNLKHFYNGVVQVQDHFRYGFVEIDI